MIAMEMDSSLIHQVVSGVITHVAPNLSSSLADEINCRGIFRLNFLILIRDMQRPNGITDMW